MQVATQNHTVNTKYFKTFKTYTATPYVTSFANQTNVCHFIA